jgi:hypothetical protein
MELKEQNVTQGGLFDDNMTVSTTLAGVGIKIEPAKSEPKKKKEK